MSYRRVDGESDYRMRKRPRFGEKFEKRVQKLRGGQAGYGSGRIPGTDRPLDPEPGLGGMFSLGLLEGKASSFLV